MAKKTQQKQTDSTAAAPTADALAGTSEMPATAPAPAFPIVAIGASAGGLEALERFLAHAASKPGVWFARRDAIARHWLAASGKG